LERLSKETLELASNLRKAGASFEEANADARRLAQTFGQLSQEEQKQIQNAARTAAALEQAAAARERAARAASDAVTAEQRMAAASQAAERAALQTATANERLSQAQANSAVSVSRAATAEEKLAQERQRTYQSTVKSEKAELDVARAREQLRAATARAEQAEKRIAETRKSTGLATDIVRKQLQALVTGGMAIAAGRQLIQFGRDSVAAASDAEEASAKFEQVFGTLSEDVGRDLSAMAETNRRSIYDLRDYASELQNTFVPLGFAREQAADFAKTITQLGIDIAAFSNKADADVIHNLTSALVGNHEAVRSYGIVLTETVIKQELARIGASELTGAALETAKAQARLNIIMRASADAQGAAVREADSYSNTLKAWDAAVTELQVALGQGLLPTMTELVGVAIQAAEVLKASGAFQEPFESALENAKSVEEIVEIVREAREDLNDLDFWDWFKVNLTDFPGLTMAEQQIQAIAKVSGDVTQFQRAAMQEFSRFEISSVADALGIEQTWNLEQTTADIYEYVQALQAKGQAERDAAEMAAAWRREQEQAAAASLAIQTDNIAPAWLDESRTRSAMDAMYAWSAELGNFAYATQTAAAAQKEFNIAFGESFNSAPVDDLVAAQQDLRDATGEWRTATIDNSGDIAAIQGQLAADLTAEQKSELQKQLKDLDDFSAEYMSIIGRLEGDLSDNERFDLSQQLAALEGRQGQETRAYTGDVEAAEDARDAIIAANQAIQDSYYERAYNSIAARLIEEGNFEQLADVAVALGIMTAEEAALRTEFAETTVALDALTESTAFYGLTAAQQAGAIKSLAAGVYETAAAAIAAQNALKATQDFYSTAPDSTQIGDYYQGLADQSGADEGITTTVSVLIDPATERAFIGFREDLEEYDATIYETEITSNAQGTIDDFEGIRDRLGDLTRRPWIIDVRYETQGVPPGAPSTAGGGIPPGANQDRSRRREGAYVDLTVNNYGGGDVGGAVKSGVMAAFRSMG